MWLGSPQQLAKVNVLEVPVASTRINVSETARYLGVVIDSQLALSAALVPAVSQWLLPTTAVPTAHPILVSRGRKDVGPGVHFVSPGLLQLTVLRHRRRSHEPTADCSECGCTHVWCRALDGTTISRQCYRSCTGFQFDVGWILRWPPWSTCHCPAWLQPIWPPIASWSPTKVPVSSCVLPHRGRAL